MPNRSGELKPVAPVQIVMIGCGSFARRYHVPVLANADLVRVTAIFDTNPTPEIESVAAKLGARIAGSLEDLLIHDADAAVIISTPHALHYPQISLCLDYGRCVLTDKPFVLVSEQARELSLRTVQQKLVGAVAFNRRFDPAYLRARQLLQNGAIGSLKLVEATQLGYETGWVHDEKLAGGGPFVGRATHLADAIPWMTGRSPLRLSARIRPGNAGRSDYGGFIDIEFEDFECRITCIEDGWRGWDEIRFFGDTGAIMVRRPLGQSLGWRLDRLSRRGEPCEELEPDETPGGATLDFLEALRDNRDPAVPFEDAVRSVRLIEAAYDSVQCGGQWVEI